MKNAASTMALRLQRPNLVVADLDRSLVVYRDILGFTVDFIKKSEATSYSYPVFGIPDSARLRFCVLSANEEQPRSLALTEVAGIALPGLPLPRRSALVLEIAEFDEVLAAISAADLAMFPAEVLHTQDGRAGRELGFVDYDGHLIVIYQIERGNE